MFKILEEEKNPEQWKFARILSLFKKGEKEKTENFRPISNLCSMTKAYKKTSASSVSRNSRKGKR